MLVLILIIVLFFVSPEVVISCLMVFGLLAFALKLFDPGFSHSSMREKKYIPKKYTDKVREIKIYLEEARKKVKRIHLENHKYGLLLMKCISTTTFEPTEDYFYKEYGYTEQRGHYQISKRIDETHPEYQNRMDYFQNVFKPNLKQAEKDLEQLELDYAKALQDAQANEKTYYEERLCE